MPEEILAALIGLGGVMAGTILGWILNSRWERRRLKQQLYESDSLTLRQALLDFEDVLEHGNLGEHLAAMRQFDLALRLMRSHHDNVDPRLARELRWYTQGEYRPDAAEILSFVRRARRTLEESLE